MGHSLEDFEPSEVEPLNGARVVAVVGPNVASTLGGVRALGTEQMFEAMKAQLSEVQNLGRLGFEHWLEGIRVG